MTQPDSYSLMQLNYDKRYMSFNGYHLSMCADYLTIKRRVDDLFINYCKEKL